MKTEPSEIVFKCGPVEPHKPYEMHIGTKTIFRGEELVVKTTEGFSICSLWFDGTNALGFSGGDKLPAIMFSEDAALESRFVLTGTVYPWPAGNITLVVENDTDEPRDFEAVLKGKAVVKDE